MNKIDKLKEHELTILDEIDRICKKYNIKYYLAFGTALGAIRHKGFIPWDDDIDIHMLSKDLKRFKQVCKYELSDKFYYQDKLTDKYYYNYWTKIGLENTTWMPKNRLVDCKYGICVDIFPIFSMKDTKKDKKRIDRYTKLLLITSSKYFVLKNKEYQCSKYKRLIHKLIPNSINNMIYNYAYNKLTLKDNKYDKIVISSITKDKNIFFNKEDIIGNKTLSFENRNLPVANDLDKYLTTFYGDYMKLPKEEDRYGHDKNNNIIYDFENSYKKYIGDKND